MRNIGCVLALMLLLQTLCQGRAGGEEYRLPGEPVEKSVESLGSERKVNRLKPIPGLRAFAAIRKAKLPLSPILPQANLALEPTKKEAPTTLAAGLGLLSTLSRVPEKSELGRTEPSLKPNILRPTPMDTRRLLEAVGLKPLYAGRLIQAVSVKTGRLFVPAGSKN
jgi:hypothetical protein